MKITANGPRQGESQREVENTLALLARLAWFSGPSGAIVRAENEADQTRFTLVFHQDYADMDLVMKVCLQLTHLGWMVQAEADNFEGL